MSLQLIFVVETNKKCQSDWIYIKDTIERFCDFDSLHTKLSPLYMDGKAKYKGKVREIKDLEKKFASQSKENRTVVLYCFDCDNYDTSPEDERFLKEAREFCNDHGYEFVWFCKDIERVYIGKKVEDKQKKAEAEKFKRQQGIDKVDASKLEYRNYTNGCSNLIGILSEYLSFKEK